MKRMFLRHINLIFYNKKRLFLTTVFLTVAYATGLAGVLDTVFTAGFGKTRVISDAFADTELNIGVTSAITATEIAA